jgi:hypothetical protein
MAVMPTSSMTQFVPAAHFHFPYPCPPSYGGERHPPYNWVRD